MGAPITASNVCSVYLRSGWCGKNVSISYVLTLQPVPRLSNERSPLFVINSGVAVRIAFSSAAAAESKFESEAKERGVPNREQRGTEVVADGPGWQDEEVREKKRRREAEKER